MDSVEGNMGHVIRVKIPRMQISRLVPLGSDKCAGLCAGFDNRTRVRGVVRIDVQNHVPTGLGKNRSNVRNSFFAVSLRNEGDVVGANGFRKGRTALIPGRVIGVG
jgi:hypothetical protein